MRPTPLEVTDKDAAALRERMTALEIENDALRRDVEALCKIAETALSR